MSPLLTVRNLTIRRNERVIINNVSFELNRGDFLLLQGANGSGKSSLLNAIRTFATRTDGAICLNSTGGLAYLGQQPEASLFHHLTVAENIRLFCGRMQGEEFLRNQAPSLVHHFTTKVMRLSGGEKQLLATVLHLQRGSDILLLDEHTSALDIQAEQRVLEKTISANKNGQTIIMVSHRREHSKYATKTMTLVSPK